MTDLPGTTSMSPSQRAERNRRLAADRAAGMPWADLGAKYGISERQARRARDEALAFDASGLADDPGALLARVVGAHVRAIDRLDDLIDSETESIALGACHRLPAAALGLFEILERAGLVPHSARAWRFLQDVPALIGAFGRAADDAGLDRRVWLEALGVQLDQTAPGARRLTASEGT